MALWYQCGNGWAKTSFARKDNNCSAFLCCGGPSLKDIDPTKLKGHNRIVFGLNNTYPFVIPDVWVGMDDPKCYHRDIFHQSFVKIMRGNYDDRTIDEGRVDHLFNLFYADCGKPDTFEHTFTSRQHDTKFVWHKSTISIALHIIVWMGCSNIYLFGNDLSNAKSDYFDPNVKLSKENHNYNSKFYSAVYSYLKKFYRIGKQYGINLYSCTKESTANDFLEYVDHLPLIDTLNADVPAPGPLYHAVDAEASRKEGECRAGKAAPPEKR